MPRQQQRHCNLVKFRLYVKNPPFPVIDESPGEVCLCQRNWKAHPILAKFPKHSGGQGLLWCHRQGAHNRVFNINRGIEPARSLQLPASISCKLIKSKVVFGCRTGHPRPEVRGFSRQLDKLARYKYFKDPS